MTPTWTDEKFGVDLYLSDCMDVMPGLAAVDAVVTDPPYGGVLDEEWDARNPGDILEMIDNLAAFSKRALANNGSMFCFASSIMSARVEVVIRKYLHILNSIVWSKGNNRQGAAGSGIDVTALRRFWSSTTERIVFAEQIGSDCDYGHALITENGTYDSECVKAKRRIMGEYLEEEMARANATNREISALFPSRSGGLTGCVSNWITGANMPTKEQYKAIREYLNKKGRAEYLRRDYEDLRRDYEDLRRDYEDLRRPFNLDNTMQWGEVWQFDPVRNAQHPAQKPIILLEHIVLSSTRGSGVVCDPFMGSGTTGVAAVNLGRKFIGVEKEPKYFEIAVERIRQAIIMKQDGPLFADHEPAQLELSEEAAIASS